VNVYTEITTGRRLDRLNRRVSRPRGATDNLVFDGCGNDYAGLGWRAARKIVSTTGENAPRCLVKRVR